MDDLAPGLFESTRHEADERLSRLCIDGIGSQVRDHFQLDDSLVDPR
jgi:hypothetical protein